MHFFCWHSTDYLLVLLSTHPREFSHPATKHSNVFDPDLDPNTHLFYGNKNHPVYQYRVAQKVEHRLMTIILSNR